MKTAQDLGLSRPVLYVNGSGKKALLDSTRIAATATGRAVECADDAAPERVTCDGRFGREKRAAAIKASDKAEYEYDDAVRKLLESQ